ncbi:MAG: hypothetical protein ACI32H_04635 [Bacilli bacterium]
MKKFIKNNIAILISFTILFAFATFLCVKQVINDREIKQLRIEIKEECKDILEKGIENEICQNIVNREEIKTDTLTTFYEITNGSDYIYIYNFMVPFLIIMSSLYNASKKFKSGEIKNRLTRESYNSYIKEVFKDSYKSVIIWPLISIYMFLFSYIISGTFEVATINVATFSAEILSNPALFIISYLLNTILMSIFYINIGLFLVPENRSYLVTVIETIMVYFGITLANTFFVIGFLLKDFEDGEKYFDFLDMYTYNDRELIPFNLLCLGVAFISSLVVYLKYRNKEKLVIKLEKK